MKEALVAAIIVITALAAPPLLAYLSGSMFSQRCAKAYPNADYIAWEECVQRLAAGGQLRSPLSKD